MTKVICAVWGLMLGSVLVAAAEVVPVIPRPEKVMLEDGKCVIRAGGFVYESGVMEPAAFEVYSKAAGFPLRMAPADAQCVIQILGVDLFPAKKGIGKPGGEGYALRLHPSGITAYAATEVGRFHARQTILQLLAGGEKAADGRSLSLPRGWIADRPRFAWRGFMLDESRHFTGMEGVKRLLDAMARYKLNRFHWHLTDSPGWRIEIKAYPKLTEVGSRGSETDRSADAPRQFYTQEQIREIVAYARERHITVIPEIDMPGHADAAVRAYPGLSGGGSKKWPNFTFNPAKAETHEFLDTVLAEVKELFPDAGVIHYGGDEAHFGWGKWLELPEVKALMEKEGFSKREEVEKWFNLRMARSVNDLGFTTGGWDEVAGKGLDPEKTLVFWWRHDKPKVLRRALDDGYEVVLCPRRPVYFDFVQHGSHKVGRRWGGFNPLRDVHAFPDGLKLSEQDFKQVKGIQANLWTETTVTQERRDFMTWPRLIALAEAAWTSPERKDFELFETKLPAELKWLRTHGIEPWDPFEKSPEIKR